MKVSLITPTFNSEKTICQCLKSIEFQGITNIEHLIIDGLSKDSTIQKINNFEGKVQRVIVSEHDTGIYDAINKGIRKSTGDIIGLLHSDDQLVNYIIPDIIEIFYKFPEVVAVYGNLEYKNSDFSKVIRRWKSKDYSSQLLKLGWMPPHPTIFIRREIFTKIGFYNDDFKISGDYDFILRFFKNYGEKTYYLDKNFYQMRVGGISNSKNIKMLILKLKEDYEAIKINQIGGLKTLLYKSITKIPQFFSIR